MRIRLSLLFVLGLAAGLVLSLAGQSVAGESHRYRSKSYSGHVSGHDGHRVYRTHRSQRVKRHRSHRQNHYRVQRSHRVHRERRHYDSHVYQPVARTRFCRTTLEWRDDGWGARQVRVHRCILVRNDLLGHYQNDW